MRRPLTKAAIRMLTENPTIALITKNEDIVIYWNENTNLYEVKSKGETIYSTQFDKEKDLIKWVNKLQINNAPITWYHTNEFGLYTPKQPQ